MELAFIWIEKFRNIEIQGFNISSKYFFRYDHQRNYLKVEKNPRYIPDFFGPEISNITGIIGQNASGKTNLLELILYTIDGGKTKIKNPFLIVFENNGSLLGYHHGIVNDPKSNWQINFIIYQKKVLLKSIFISNTFDGRDHNFGKSVFNGSLNNLITVSFGPSVQKNIKNEVIKQLAFFKSTAFKILENVEKETNPDSNFRLLPEHVLITSPTWNNIKSRAKKFDENVKQSLKLKEYNDLTSFCQSFRSKITENKSKMAINYFAAFLIYLDFVFHDFQANFMTTRNLINEEFKGFLFDTDAYSFQEKLNKLGIDKIKNERIDEVFKFLTESFSKPPINDLRISEEKLYFLESLPNYQLVTLDYLFEGVNEDRKALYLLQLTPMLEEFLSDYYSASANQYLTLKIDWIGISSGHKAFISLFSRIHEIEDLITSKNILICIDEGDLYFHPKWQTEFVYKLIKVLPLIFERRTIQLILSTHSPFLVSDLPKENLIFLKKDSEGNCKVQDKSNEDFETFGGNIGELYLDAFFLKGSLVSYFAATKIKDLIKKVREQGKFDKEDEILTSLIGEEIIRLQLRKMRDDIN